jgi:hypothetical protein
MSAPIAWRWLAAIAALWSMGGSAQAADIFESPPPPSSRFPTSIRSAAMGGAGAAVLWGEPDVWANPAALSIVRGVGWVSGYTKVAPDFPIDLTFDSDRLLLGGAGLGLSLMGQPIAGVGRARYDTGPITISDGFGTDEFRVIDETRSWAIGLSPLRLIDAIRRWQGSTASALSDRGEISVGYQGKRTFARVEPGGSDLEEGSAYDWGVSGRFPLERLWGPDAAFRLDLSGAYSESGHLVENTREFGGPPTRFDRTGVALRLSPPPLKRTAEAISTPWWRPDDAPNVTLGIAYDHEHRIDARLSKDDHVHRIGFEANFLALLGLRAGYSSDRAGNAQGVTYGGGVSLPIGPWGHLGYDLADVPRPNGSDRQLRQGWSAWVDPVRFFERVR